MTTEFMQELQTIAGEVRVLLADAALRPNFAPAELLQATLAYPQAGGKALRPALTTWACLALGGPRAAALRAGAAIELYHTYTLVHDDVIDRDPLRRGRPSAHALMETVGNARFGLFGNDAAHYGLSMAILAGDCLQSWAIDLLGSLPELGIDPAIALRLIRRMEGVTGPAIVEGEARDIQLPFTAVNAVRESDIYRVIRTKTAALFAYCAWAGALLARGQEDAQVRALEAFAEEAGIAFQLQDDVLGIIADEATLGKPVGNDLREGKRTLIIALAWARADAVQRATLTTALGNPAATPDEIAQASAILLESGAVVDTQTIANDYLQTALLHLEQLPDTPYRTLLHDYASMMVKREK